MSLWCFVCWLRRAKQATTVLPFPLARIRWGLNRVLGFDAERRFGVINTLRGCTRDVNGQNARELPLA